MWIDELEAGPDGDTELPDRPLTDLIRSTGRPVGSASALYSLGTDSELAGRAVRDLGQIVESEDHVVVHGGRDVLDLDLDAPILPLFLDLEFAQEQRGDIAVAVNGIIAVTGRVGGPDGRHLWVVLPPSLVSSGRNEVTVYRVSDTADGDELTLLTTSID